MGFCSYLKNVFKRMFLYQFLIFFAIFRLINAYRFYIDFQAKIGLILPTPIYNLQPTDREVSYKAYNISLIVLASLSIVFGCGCCQFLTGLATIFTGFVFYNPIEEFKAKKINSFEDYLPTTYFLVCFVIGLAMISSSFACSGCQKKEVPKNETEQKQEVEMSAKSASKETKKKGGKKKEM